MITGIYGDLGSGKTLYMTSLLRLYSMAGFKVYTNYWVAFPHTLIDNKFIKDIVKKNMNLGKEKSVFGLDEYDMYADSRRSTSKNNLLNSYLVKQIRKKRIRILYTCQTIDRIDRRVRDLTRFKVFCQAVNKKVETEFGAINIMTIYVTKYFGNKKLSTRKLIANNYYDLYDTEELIVYDEGDEDDED